MVTTALPCRASSSIFSSLKLRRRFPIVGAICVLTFGLSNFFPSHFQTTRSAVAFPFAPLLRSKLTTKEQSRNFQAARMEASGSIVPSIVVYCTVPNKDAGVESVYEWKGEIQTDAEELLIIKTRESLLGALIEHIKANHEYEVPEVISLPITGGNLQYLEWLKNSTKE